MSSSLLHDAFGWPIRVFKPRGAQRLMLSLRKNNFHSLKYSQLIRFSTWEGRTWQRHCVEFDVNRTKRVLLGTSWTKLLAWEVRYCMEKALKWIKRSRLTMQVEVKTCWIVMHFVNKGALGIDVSAGKYDNIYLKGLWLVRTSHTRCGIRHSLGIVSLIRGQLRWPPHWPPLEEGVHGETDISPRGFWLQANLVITQAL